MKKVVLLVKPEGVYDRRLLRGIAKYTHSHESWSIFHEIEQEKRALHFVKNWGAHGIIADFREAEKIYEAFPEIPLITIGANKVESNIPNVLSDADAIAQIAFDHYNERGFKNFAFCGYSDLNWSTNRRASFQNILNRYKLPCPCFMTRYSGARMSWEKELNMLMDWVLYLPKPVAIMACNDEFGRHVIEACKVANLYLPEEVAVIGVDDDDIICNLCTPTLSSIYIDTDVAGYKTAELLDSIMDGEAMNGQLIIAEPTEIEVRGSSDIFLIDDPEINKTLYYIHENCSRPLDVNEIAEYACKSRRGLHNSFKKAVGMSVSQYVRTVRIKHISRLLLKTDLSLSQIAIQMGYSGPDKISRIFRREKGLSPSQYRKKFGNR